MKKVLHWRFNLKKLWFIYLLVVNSFGQSAPVITTQPVSQTIVLGSPVTFTVVATGNPAPTYQWKRWGNNISGANSASYTIPATSYSDNGSQFTVVVTNSYGSATSAGANLVITSCQSVNITTQPVATVTVSAPATATFSLTVSGSSPIYQWQQSTDGTTFTNIAGATSATYTTLATTSSMNGYKYRCYVSNSCPSNITSNTSTLTVTGSSCTDVSITTQPSTAVSVEVPATATFNVVVNGTSPAYQWQNSTDGGTTFTNISGATSSSYTTPATTSSMNGYYYRCYVSNSCPSTETSSNSMLTVNYAPAITTQPFDATILVGSTTTFTVTTTGNPTPNYQWRKNGINISGAISASYTTPAVTTSDNGAQYSVVITNSVGNLISNNATLTVTDVCSNVSINTQPSVVTVESPAVAMFSVVASGTSPTYQWQLSTDGGTTYTNISGATSASYTTPATVTSMNGYRYRCYISNSCPSNITSNEVTLTVSAGALTYYYPNQCGANQNMKVDGQIKCSSLLIHNWLFSQKGAPQVPDYVFEKDYRLLSLKETELYIKNNGHLPDVPAANEFESSGVDVIQLNFILLKKIEEMTLHMIAQEKKLQEMEKKLNK